MCKHAGKCQIIFQKASFWRYCLISCIFRILIRRPISCTTQSDAVCQMFGGVRSLETLILSRNPISFISPSTFSQMSSLRELSINKAKLSHVRAGAFDGLVSVRSLALNDNALVQLPDRLFAGLRSLRKVFLEEAGTHKSAKTSASMFL